MAERSTMFRVINTYTGRPVKTTPKRLTKAQAEQAVRWYSPQMVSPDHLAIVPEDEVPPW